MNSLCNVGGRELHGECCIANGCAVVVTNFHTAWNAHCIECTCCSMAAIWVAGEQRGVLHVVSDELIHGMMSWLTDTPIYRARHGNMFYCMRSCFEVVQPVRCMAWLHG